MKKSGRFLICTLLAIICSFVVSTQAMATHAENVTALKANLPADARGVLAVDMTAISGIPGAGVDPALNEPFVIINKLVENMDTDCTMDTALLVQMEDASFLLLAILAIDPACSPTTGVDANGNELALITGGMVIGKPVHVSSVVAGGGTSDIDPYLSALNGGSPFTFVYGLPAMFKSITPDRSLRGAKLVSGSLDFAGTNISGSVSFHTENASDFVTAYNNLDSASEETPLTDNDPIGSTGLRQATVTISPTAITGNDLVTSRNTLKKLTIGMNAYDYGEDVEDGGNKPYLALTVLGRDDSQNQGGSIFFRWEFYPDNVVSGQYIDDPAVDGDVWRDPLCPDPDPTNSNCTPRNAVEAFNQDQLYGGIELSDLVFLEGDTPAKFLVLNIYTSGGGTVVDGVRAEFDIFVKPNPASTDWDPDVAWRPRFMVRDALAEKISAEALHGFTQAEPLSYTLNPLTGESTISVGVYDEDGETILPVFDATYIQRPSGPSADPVVRFTREMAICNDYIYWANGVFDRVFYNSSTVNFDSWLADPADIDITRHEAFDNHLFQYLKEDLTYGVYYTNDLEYIATPWENLHPDNEFLNFEPNDGVDWLDLFNLNPKEGWYAELYGFKYNEHERTWMRDQAQTSFRGQGDSIAPMIVANATNGAPATYYNFIINDVSGLEAELGLPSGYSLAPTHFFTDGTDAHYLTLKVYKIEDSLEGIRAEWSVYVDGGNGRENMMIIDLQTEDAALDPASMINLPSSVAHSLGSTVLSSSTIAFDADFTGGTGNEELSLDWIEAEELICSINGICNKLYWDAETLDVPVTLPVAGTVSVTMTTPWNGFINTTPSVVFYRDNTQELSYRPWHNLQVYVEDPDVVVNACGDGTHIVNGTGSMIGRTNSAVNSTYVYFGSAVVNESTNEMEFCYNQTATNAIGSAVYKFTGSFPLDEGAVTGTFTQVSCTPQTALSSLMCAGFVSGQEADYFVEGLDASDLANVTWEVNFEQEIASMGWVDSASTLTATEADCTDDDGDLFYQEGGVCGEVDCDDTDPDINPVAEENLYDLIDHNCNGNPFCFIGTAFSFN